ncbi:MAG: hypothetical protein FWH18_08785 [Marinilabiliaceae bacterium]|nr:hypothetical protein [Marinilabiliaceae bacterium]
MAQLKKSISKKSDGIKIANPIYDTVFKYLMENRRVARFFIETLIGEKITEIAVIPQEYVYKKVTRENEKEKENERTKKVTKSNTYEFFSIIRYDFLATILTEKGEYKKVLIEIQKSRKYTELERFRNYLGERYKQVDLINAKTGEAEESLPIICIYIVGFKLLDHETAALKVGRVYYDLITKKRMSGKDKFVEALTHDGFFVQIPRIKGKPRNILEKMLSVFEQSYFIDSKEIVKIYEHQVDNEIIKEMLDILRNVAADPEDIKAIEAERFAIRDEEGYEKALQTIKEQGKTITTQGKTIAALQNEKVAQDNTIADLQTKLEEYERKFGNLNFE